VRTAMKHRFTLALVCVLAAAVAAPVCAVAQQPPDSFTPPHTYLGVFIRDITSERAKALNLKEETGVEVTMVDQDAPAGKAGIREHDVILSFNGHKVESAEKLRRLVRETPSGRSVPVGIQRDGQPQTVSVTLADRHEIMREWSTRNWPDHGPGGAPGMQPPAPLPGGMGDSFLEHSWMEMEVPSFTVAQSSSRTGITVESLTPQLAEYFGAKQGNGVLVRAVEKGSQAEKGGLRAGDVIIKVDKDVINDVGDWRRAMHGHSGAVVMIVLRDRKEQTLTIQIPERKHHDTSRLPHGIGDLESLLDLDAVQAQIDRLGPEIEKSIELSARAWEAHRGDLDRMRGEVEKQMRELEQHQQDFQEMFLPSDPI